MKDVALKIKCLWPCLVNGYRMWLSEVWHQELDEPYCCNDGDCGCGGLTTRDVWIDGKS